MFAQYNFVLEDNNTLIAEQKDEGKFPNFYEVK